MWENKYLLWRNALTLRVILKSVLATKHLAHWSVVPLGRSHRSWRGIPWLCRSRVFLFRASGLAFAEGDGPKMSSFSSSFTIESILSRPNHRHRCIPCPLPHPYPLMPSPPNFLGMPESFIFFLSFLQTVCGLRASWSHFCLFKMCYSPQTQTCDPTENFTDLQSTKPLILQARHGSDCED